MAACGIIPALLLAVPCAQGMTYEPFHFCTESARVDSLVDRVWIDESLIPENAPYSGVLRYTYHPGTCIPSQVVQKPYYMDHDLTFNYALRADGRSLDFTLGPGEDMLRGLIWVTVDGKVDSILLREPGFDGDPADSVYRMERHVQKTGYQSITKSIRRGAGPWTLFSSDSIVTSGDITTIHTVDEEGNHITRCAQDGATYACIPTPVGPVNTELHKEVWHLSGTRVDSLRTYKLDGRLESVRYYYWSPRGSIAVRKLRKHPGGFRRPVNGFGYRLDGRRIIHP